ncbi:hypothetical protein L581_3840 [Serratia fonticola AU-AP2C]|nr:hypothetical protein L581_3840 [Serratia fonticola AU-AP2C]
MVINRKLHGNKVKTGNALFIRLISLLPRQLIPPWMKATHDE